MSLVTGSVGGATPAIPPAAIDRRYHRIAWLALGLGLIVFCVLCGGGIYTAWKYAQQPNVAHTATVELEHGSKLELRRAGQKAWVLIGKSQTVSEGDEIRTGPDTDALITLFDQSTIHLDYSTTVSLTIMRSTRFLTHIKDIRVEPASGSIVVAAAALADEESMKFYVTSVDGQIFVRVPATAVVRVEVPDPPGETLRMRVTTVAGSAALRVPPGPWQNLPLDRMFQVAADNTLRGPDPAITDLVKNPRFKAASTSDDELADNWVLTLPAVNPGDPQIDARRVSENQGGSPVYSARFTRSEPVLDRFPREPATASIKQVIDRPVGLYQAINVTATVNVDSQYKPAQDYPLTLRVSYEDAQGQPGIWERSLYPDPSAFPPSPLAIPLRAGLAIDLPRPASSQLPPAAQPDTWDLMTQVPRPARIKAVELITSGYLFDVFVTRFSLIAH
ncbi:MAG TPA: hypothetical protein VKY74_17690 [Chloroflexia bacterium]|nr:hypothetical protein [Chloroflexia bacterium]